jgi:hypothetical protein
MLNPNMQLITELLLPSDMVSMNAHCCCVMHSTGLLPSSTAQPMFALAPHPVNTHTCKPTYNHNPQ